MITLLICLGLSYYSTKIEVEAKSTSFFLEDDKDLQLFNESIKTFGSQDFLVLAYKSQGDVFSIESIEKLQNIEKKLLKIDGVKSVLSILNAPLFLSDGKSINEGANLLKAKDEISKNKFYLKNLISQDYSVVDFLIYANNPDDLIVTLKQFALDNDLILGGMSVIASDMITYVKSDLYVYGIGLFVLLSIAIFIFFRSLYFVFVCMFICLISLFSTTGILAILGYNITVISSNYVALVLIITISVIVHLLSHFSELINFNKNTDRLTQVRHTLLAKAKPSFYAILTTVVGFLSLVFSGIKPISELGVMMSIGISVSLLLCYLYLPYLLLAKKDFKNVYFAKEPKFLLFCANTAINHRKIVYFVSLIIVVFAIVSIPKLSAENSFVNYFKDSSDIKKGLLLIDEKLGGTLPLDVIVKFNDEDDEQADEFAEFLDNSDKYYLTPSKVEILKKIHNFLENQNYVGSVLSLYSLLDFAKSMNNGKDIDGFLLNILQNNLEESTKKQIIYPYYNEKSKEFRIAIRMVDSDKTLKRAKFLKDLNDNLRELTKNDNINIQVSGVMVLYNNMLSSLISSQVDTLNFVILSLFALFLIIFRNIRFSIIGIIANLIPISLLFAIIAFSGLSLDLMSIIIAAISIGIGVDDIIHYVHRFKEEIKKRNLNDAIRASHQSIGSALYYTTCTIVLGFCLMMSSNFTPTIYFGLLTVLVMILLLCGSLFLLPSLIISLYFKGYFKNELSKKDLSA
ncbi:MULTISPECIES: MMPL family transporter [unclassified Campylobacter]|uniref:efflux RND transporter permease subunit n=1 Tax=unclassified Campylobacter TaxID=2593542 RepID=UPI0020243381|nr:MULTISPECIES: MMPL family transporter [unclassified Campylobacter]